MEWRSSSPVCRLPVGAEVMGMARLIEFYIPESFRRKVKWVPPGLRGKLIEFRTGLKQSA